MLDTRVLVNKLPGRCRRISSLFNPLIELMITTSLAAVRIMTYNHDLCIRKELEWALPQFANFAFEVVVVDVSKDHTVKIAKERSNRAISGAD